MRRGRARAVGSVVLVALVPVAAAVLSADPSWFLVALVVLALGLLGVVTVHGRPGRPPRPRG